MGREKLTSFVSLSPSSSYKMISHFRVVAFCNVDMSDNYKLTSFYIPSYDTIRVIFFLILPLLPMESS